MFFSAKKKHAHYTLLAQVLNKKVKSAQECFDLNRKKAVLLSAASGLHTRHVLSAGCIAVLFGLVSRVPFSLQASVAGAEENDEATGEESAQSCHHHHGHSPSQECVPAGGQRRVSGLFG